MFTIHRSERADALVDALAEVVSHPLADPFTPEVVAVPTRGVERWLTHRLAAVVGASEGRADGVCANVAFPFPGRLVGDVLAEATDVAREEDPWRPERLVWPLLEVLDECVDEPWLALVAAHLGHGGERDDDPLRQDRRFATARHLAELFDGYGIYRPELVLGWADHDGAGPFPGVPPDAQWQPRLWRRLRDRVARPSPPERIASACADIAAGEIEPPLPERVSLFGLTRLPSTYLDVLRAVATHRDVHLFALHPSLALWQRIAATPTPSLPCPRAEDPTTSVPDNPLLRTWGTDTREMQLVLSDAADAQQAHHPIPEDPPTTLLARLQADVRADRAPPGAPVEGPDRRLVPAPGDRSVQVHACHGRQRQVEVARDAICHALADDPSLEPRDVIVLCPDIDEFAPLLHATFGATEPDPPTDPSVAAGGPRTGPGDAERRRGLPHLRYRLADRPLRQTNPLLAGLDALLELVDSRLTAPDLVSFLGRDPVRARFGLDDDDIERVEAWTASSHVRWGLDAARRSRYWLGDVDANTWRAGLDRLLLGVTMSTDGSRLLGGRLPLDDVESGDVELAGRFAELIERIDAVVTFAADRHPVDAWAELLGDAVDLLMASRPGQDWQRVQVDAVLRDVVAEATSADRTAAAPLSLAEVRSLLAHRLRGLPTRADFRTGAITMCTLVPMRAIPHRVVCILGLDDSTFPRSSRADGDDLLRRDPMVGGHDRRVEDRQLLLDALLSAGDRLIITTTGADPRTNEARPPAVPLSELLDVVDRTARQPDDRPATDAVVTAHPLQPFDPWSYRDDGDGPWALDRVGLAGARAVVGPRDAAPPFLDAPLPAPPTEGLLGVDELTRFVQHPAREFLRQRLGLNVWDDDDALDDAIPVELDALERWGIGQRLLDRLLDGDALDAAVDAELAVGALPPEAMGRQAIGDIEATATRIHAIADAAGVSGVGESREVDVALSPTALGRIDLVGTVAGIRGDATAHVSFSSVRARQRLGTWVRLLALSAAHPDVAWRGVTVGKHRNGGRVVDLGPLDGPPQARRTRAVELLEDLVALRHRGMCEPLPVPCKTAAAWAGARRAGRDPARSAARDWASSRMMPGEDADRSHQRVFGGVRRLDELLALAPTEAECGPGWADEPSRLGRLARRIWDPLLELETWR